MISVTVCGHDSHHTTPCHMEHRNGLPDYLLLLIKAESWFMLDGKKVPVYPGTVILFDPGTYICYGRELPGYNDDWIHFASDEEENAFWNTLSLPHNRPVTPMDFPRLSRFIHLLTLEFRVPTSHSSAILDSLMHSLLYTLDSQIPKLENCGIEHHYYSDFSRLRASIYNNPAEDWSSERIAGSLNLSVSYFQHLYKQFFCSSCRHDVIQARLEQAKFYLKTSSMSIRNLAEFCGYGNELHFMRQFKKFEGMTPSEFRSRSMD